MLRHSTSAVIARNELWTDSCTTEPYEAGWARELVVFARLLDFNGVSMPEARVEISPDGIHWAEEGTSFAMPERTGVTTFCKVSHFGNWVRLRCDLPNGTEAKVLISFHVK